MKLTIEITAKTPSGCAVSLKANINPDGDYSRYEATRYKKELTDALHDALRTKFYSSEIKIK